MASLLKIITISFIYYCCIVFEIPKVMKDFKNLGNVVPCQILPQFDGPYSKSSCEWILIHQAISILFLLAISLKALGARIHPFSIWLLSAVFTFLVAVNANNLGGTEEKYAKAINAIYLGVINSLLGLGFDYAATLAVGAVPCLVGMLGLVKYCSSLGDWSNLIAFLTLFALWIMAVFKWDYEDFSAERYNSVETKKEE